MIYQNKLHSTADFLPKLPPEHYLIFAQKMFKLGNSVLICQNWHYSTADIENSRFYAKLRKSKLSWEGGKFKNWYFAHEKFQLFGCLRNQGWNNNMMYLIISHMFKTFFNNLGVMLYKSVEKVMLYTLHLSSFRPAWDLLFFSKEWVIASYILFLRSLLRASRSWSRNKSCFMTALYHNRPP